MQPTKILFLTAELSPLAKVGGLADVAGSLPLVLTKLGVDIRIALPYYQQIKKNKKIKKIINALKIIKKDENSKINIYKTNLENTPLYLFENNRYLSQGPIYSNPNAFVGDFQEFERFMFFSLSILQTLEKINFVPDIIHCNDWHTASILMLLKSKYQNHNKFNKIKTLYTIHNLGNQGAWNPNDILKFLNLTSETNANLEARDNFGNINLMQQGILHADLINTVSQRYTKEIITSKYGMGLEKILKNNQKKLFGILNGLDINRFNPQNNPFIKSEYSEKNLDKKLTNKLFLQNQVGLPVDANIPLLGVVTRIDHQKGINLIEDIIPQLSQEKYQLIILGTGNTQHENILKKLAKKYPKKIKTLIEFNTQTAQAIYAGSDMFIVPSKFEPCGLTQMIAMNYGSLPIVRATGGLKDTVVNYQTPLNKKQTGFIFKKFDSSELLKTIKYALTVYKHDKPTWRQLQINGMQKNFSWNSSAQEYLKLYKKLLKK